MPMRIIGKSERIEWKFRFRPRSIRRCIALRLRRKKVRGKASKNSPPPRHSVEKFLPHLASKSTLNVPKFWENTFFDAMPHSRSI
ncbi:unnamed protein product, partial [Nesidiocoris tenuis]